MNLGVKLTNLFDADVGEAEMVRRAASAGATAVGYRPWYDDLAELVDAVEAEGVRLSYLSGGSPAVEGPEFPLIDPATREGAIEDLERAIDAAERVGCGAVNVIPGRRQDRLDPAEAHLAVVESLRRVAPRAERAGVTLLVEPINAVDHPGVALTASSEGYKIVDAIGSQNVQLLYDVYHQQITEGNLTANLRTHVDAIGYVHVGDVPGRQEPGTGEINYPNVLSALADAGYEGIVSCEFEPTGDPEAAIRDVGSLLESAT